MQLKKNYSLKNLTFFKIGGKARYYWSCSSFDEIRQAYQFAKNNKLKVFVLGKGSNILFKGFSGLVIHNNIDFVRILNSYVYVGAGFSFPALGRISASRNLSGLEYALGIPGSIGGAIYMNASAYGQSVKDTLQKVVYLNEDAKICFLEKSLFDLSYRSSFFQKGFGIILAAVFLLKKSFDAQNKLLEMIQWKRKSQPLDKKSAGCIFKNPEGYNAGRLIEECGLKGYKINDAKISDLHANFIINENNAAAEDILNLIMHIKKIVKKQKNVELKEELKVVEY